MISCFFFHAIFQPFFCHSINKVCVSLQWWTWRCRDSLGRSRYKQKIVDMMDYMHVLVLVHEVKVPIVIYIMTGIHRDLNRLLNFSLLF